MSKEIFEVTDLGNGERYMCSCKQAVKALIANITALPIDDEGVKDAANNCSDSFRVETLPVIGKNGY